MVPLKTAVDAEVPWDLTAQLAERLNIRVETAHPTPIRLRPPGAKINAGLQSTETQDGSDAAILIAR
jgi:hypothetical protein